MFVVMDNAPINTTPAERDPVCGREVDVSRTGHAYQHEGRFLYFCSSGCLRRFVADPARYLDERPSEAQADER